MSLYLCGKVHIISSFFAHPRQSLNLAVGAPSFPLILLSMAASLSHYSISWRCCIWGLWCSSCSLPLRPINRSLIHASFCLLHLHHWESLVVAPQQVKRAFSFQLMIISRSLNVLWRVSLSDAIPPHLHICEAVIHRRSGTFSCTDSLLFSLPPYLRAFAESILTLRDWKVFLTPSWS